MSKLKAVWDKLDGLKSVLGLLAVVAYYALPQFGVTVPEIVLKVGSGLAGLGLAHKLEKGLGILDKVLTVLVKVKEVGTKTQDTLNKDEEKK